MDRLERVGARQVLEVIDALLSIFLGGYQFLLAFLLQRLDLDFLEVRVLRHGLALLAHLLVVLLQVRKNL